MDNNRDAGWLDRCRALFHRRSNGNDEASGDAQLEAQYRRGQFDFLYAIEEIGHYMIIAGYLPYLHPTPRILDVGCGEGRLYELIRRLTDYERYVGIDIAPTAIQRAKKSHHIDKAEFVVADFEGWQTADKFDVIIFNETLYYADRPIETLLRYAGFLRRDGAMIISIHEHFGFERTWQQVPEGFSLRACDRVQNGRGQIWEVHAYQPCAV